MYLHKLELHGFKSFADRTVIQFAPGVTAIVGPNGCGKSNVIDAVRWVLGEQRARILRSDKMDNVIFNGAGKRRPLGMAEVALTVENTKHVLPTEFTDIKVARRLYRSGESEYLMNEVPCRLRDIQNLFMDTGMGAGAYSVIELKMIEDILSDQAEDRRRLFEEAAGITKYKRRRGQALRRLQNTQADLTRLRDLIDEIEKSVRKLERQAKRAGRLKTLQTELRSIALQWAQVQYSGLTETQSILQTEIRHYQDRADEIGARLSRQEAELETYRTKLIEKEQTLTQVQRNLNEQLEQIRRRETDLRLEGERIESAKRGLERAAREQTESDARKVQLEQEQEAIARQIEETRPDVEAAQEAREEAKNRRYETQLRADQQRDRLQSLGRQEQKTRTALNTLHYERDRLLNRIELQSDEQERTARQKEELTATRQTLAQRAEEVKTELQVAESNLQEAEQALQEADLEYASLQQKEEESAEVLRTLERERDALSTEIHLIEGLVASYEDVDAAIQYLATNPGWSDIPPQTVADVLACDAEDQPAVEAALGHYAECLIVQTEQEVHRAMVRLREDERGQATFIVLDRLPAVPNRPTAFPDAVPMPERVRVLEAKYEPLTRLLLGHCFLVEHLDHALDLARSATGAWHRFITPTGEWVDAQGRIYGGSRKSERSPMSRRLGQREHLAKLRDQLENIEADLKHQTESLQEVREQMQAVPLQDLKASLRQAEQAFARVEQTWMQIEYEEQTMNRDAAQLEDRMQAVEQALTQDRAGLEEKEQRLVEQEQEMKQLSKACAEAETVFQKADADAREALSAFGEANVAAVESRNAFENLQRDRERIRQTLEAIQARAETRSQEVAALESDIQASKHKRRTLEDRIRQAYLQKADQDATVQEAETAVVDVKSAISELEVELRTMRREREEALQDIHRRETRLVDSQARLANLLERTETDFEITLPEPSITVPPDFDEAAARDQVAELRTKIRNLGAVNALALETYEEEKERLDFLVSQHDDLASAEETLLNTINEINTTAARRFFDTFEQIQRHFSELFAELFSEGAQARLELGGEADPLESPIEIYARPVGKKNVTISQLSGGEKTLTAIALLFSIYLVKPSPFCILDEVDAPLDDANIGRFMHLIRKFSKETQFVLVTHNKLTMEAADRMYGITMEKKGISKVVGVRFEDVAEPVEAAV